MGPMAPHPRKRRSALVALLATVLLAPTAVTSAAAARQQPTCTAPRDKALAHRITRDLRAVLARRTGTVSVAVHDTRTGLYCTVAGDRRYDSASVVKVLMMEAALRRAEGWGRHPTVWEQRLMHPMITRSDNYATQRLWNNLGPAYVESYLRRVGTRFTALNPYGHWGLTQTTAGDQLRLLGVLTGARAVLRPSSRAYGLKLMNEVQSDQRWGVPAGMPRGIRAHLKNGWLPRATHGWRVHSVGAFTGGGRTYRIAVLSHDNPSMAYGVRTVERVAHAVHRGLNKGRALSRGYTPEREIREVPDGSAPFESAPPSGLRDVVSASPEDH